jgi:hypothetical protein
MEVGTLRDSYRTCLPEVGRDDRIIRELVGRKSIRISEFYAHEGRLMKECIPIRFDNRDMIKTQNIAFYTQSGMINKCLLWL